MPNAQGQVYEVSVEGNLKKQQQARSFVSGSCDLRTIKIYKRISYYCLSHWFSARLQACVVAPAAHSWPLLFLRVLKLLPVTWFEVCAHQWPKPRPGPFLLSPSLRFWCMSQTWLQSHNGKELEVMCPLLLSATSRLDCPPQQVLLWHDNCCNSAFLRTSALKCKSLKCTVWVYGCDSIRAILCLILSPKFDSLQ